MDNQNVQQQPVATAPARQLKTNKSLGKYILLSIVTLGIYSIVFHSSISESINEAASKYDGKKTMHFCLLFFLVGPITFGIADLVWFHRLSDRLGAEAARRGLDLGFKFDSGTFWLWGILGSLIVVGPFIYYHRLCKIVNAICADYNVRG